MDLLNPLLLLVSGAFVAFIAQRTLFSEKLQEIVYKERLAAIKEIMEALGKLQFEIYAGMEKKEERAKGHNRAMQFLLLLRSKRLFVSIESFELLKVIAAISSGFSDTSDPNELKEKLQAIEAYEAKLYPLLRKEFDIEPLIKRTKNYFREHYLSSNKSGGTMAINSPEDVR